MIKFVYLQDNIWFDNSAIWHNSIIRRDFPNFNLEHFLSFVEDNIYADSEIVWQNVENDILKHHNETNIDDALNGEAFRKE